MQPILEVNDISVTFGGIKAVDGASFTLNQGELIGFVGPNGAGKSTLMKVLTGVVAPKSGSVRLNGKDILGLPTHQRIREGLALAQQIVQPLKKFTLLENVSLACGLAKTANPLRSMIQFDRGIEKEKATELLSRVGLDKNTLNSYPDELPLGFLKRLEVARAIALEPKLLLLDEPLAGLNQSEAESLADLILSLNKDGLSILFIEHNLKEVMRICPKVYVQDQGRPLAFGDTKLVMSMPDVIRAYLGE